MNKESKLSGVIMSRIKTRWKSFSNAGHPAAQQKTPLGTNRYILLGLYTYIAFTTSAVYLNWAPMSEILFRHEAFSYKCDKYVDGRYVNDQRTVSNKLYICDEQDSAVHNIFPICSACHCIFSVIAGFMTDTYGMKLTSTFGQLLQLVSWILLSFASNSFNSYYAAFIILGFACDTSFIPLLLVSNLFPKNNALTITLLGSAASLSFCIPTIINSMISSGLALRDSVFIYIAFAIFPSLLISLILMPKKNFLGIDKFELHDNNDTDNDINNTDNIITIVHSDDVEATSSGKNSQKEDVLHEKFDFCRKLTEAKGVNPTREFTHSNSSINNDNDRKVCEQAETGILPKAAIRQFTSTPYIMMVLYFVITSIYMAYYEQAHGRIFDNKDIVKLFEILLPLSCIPCIMLGRLIDIFGSLPIVCVVNLTHWLAYVLVIGRTDVTRVLSVLSFIVFISMFTSQIGCFIEENFDTKHFGKLMGTVFAVGGLISLVSMPLYRIVTVEGGHLTLMITTGAVALAFNFVLLYVVYKSLPGLRKIVNR